MLYVNESSARHFQALLLSQLRPQAGPRLWPQHIWLLLGGGLGSVGAAGDRDLEGGLLAEPSLWWCWRLSLERQQTLISLGLWVLVLSKLQAIGRSSLQSQERHAVRNETNSAW